ncbi:MAG: fused MFS/spermidine synthase [Vicinamibacterales bacterium]
MIGSAILPGTVFVTGACVLIIEVLAVRVLSPHYGNTIFTVSSVLSVILLALSAGYYLGGRLADRRPSLQWFYGIILAGGVSLLLLQWLATPMLTAFGDRFSIAVGPLVFSALLFLLPALLLGTLSPYAVKLQSAASSSGVAIGGIAGSIFFWSTLGSIVGSLLAGFVLIPNFGVSRVLTATGLLLIAVGSFAVLVRRQAALWVLPLAAAGLLAGQRAWALEPAGPEVLHRADGVYQKVTIYEGQYYDRPTRFLLLDRSESGAMFLDSTVPNELVYDYTKYYSLYRIFSPQVDRALVLGGGAYSIPKALVHELPGAIVDVAEIEPSLYDLSRQYFRLEESPRLRNAVQDGRRFLQEAREPYDLIFGDVYYSYFSVPPQFTTQEFFALARDRLAPGGVFIANMIGDLSRRAPSLILAEIKTFRTVFPNSYFFAVESPERADLVQNITLVGYKSDRIVDLTAPPVSTHPDQLIRFLRYRSLDIARRFELSPYPLLTDDFSPVEYLTARVLQRSLGKVSAVDGEEMVALRDQLLRYGPTARGSEGILRVREFVEAELAVLTQEVLTQRTTVTEGTGTAQPIANIAGKLFASDEHRVVLTTRMDRSPAGVALLVELARHLVTSPVPPAVGVDLVFLDGEAGERYLASHQQEILGEGRLVSTLPVDERYRAELETGNAESLAAVATAIRGMLSIRP